MQVGMYDKSIEFKKGYILQDLSWARCQFTLLQGFSCLVVAPFPNGTTPQRTPPICTIPRPSHDQEYQYLTTMPAQLHLPLPLRWRLPNF